MDTNYSYNNLGLCSKLYKFVLIAKCSVSSFDEFNVKLPIKKRFPYFLLNRYQFL